MAVKSNLFNTGSDEANLGKHRIQAHGPDNGVKITVGAVRASSSEPTARMIVTVRAHLNAMFYLENVSISAAEAILSWKSLGSM